MESLISFQSDWSHFRYPNRNNNFSPYPYLKESAYNSAEIRKLFSCAKDRMREKTRERKTKTKLAETNFF